MENQGSAVAQDMAGWVCFVEETPEQDLKKVREAAESAGIDPAKIYDVKDRNAFIRSMQQLQREGHVQVRADADGMLRHKLLDDDAIITFQFSEYYVQASGAQYDKAALIQFSKTSCAITCSNPALKAMAEQLFGAARKHLKAVDINNMVARLVKEKCHRVPLRDAVYFIPLQARELVEQLKKFYSGIGITWHVYPVRHADGQSEAILKAVVKDMKGEFESLQKEIDALKADKTLTKRIAKARLKELKKRLDEYRDLATALRGSLGSLLEDAGTAGQCLVQAAMPLDALVAHIQRGNKLAPLMADLIAGSEEQPVIEAIAKARVLAGDVDVLPDPQGVLFEALPVPVRR